MYLVMYLTPRVLRLLCFVANEPRRRHIQKAFAFVVGQS